uniref:Uncharacterized protein n=1 Tax=Candidozyma auris TaxID=498019 RepID=A0A0L0NTX0_CANAR
MIISKTLFKKIFPRSPQWRSDTLPIVKLVADLSFRIRAFSALFVPHSGGGFLGEVGRALHTARAGGMDRFLRSATFAKNDEILEYLREIRF